MLGWRGKIGLLVPANNTIIEPELNAMAAQGIGVYATRMIVEGAFEPEALHRMEKHASRGLEELAISKVDICVYACLSTSLAKGREWEDNFCGQSTNNLPVITAAQCVINALAALKLKNIGVLTPYPAGIQRLVAPYFTKEGFNLTQLATLDIADMTEVTQLPPERLYGFARKMISPDTEALCILATDLPTLSIIPVLEQDLGVPVISTNLAIYWAALQSLGIKQGSPYPDCALLKL